MCSIERPDMLATGYFTEASFIQVGGHGPPSVHVCMCRNCSQWFAVQWNYLDVYVSCAVRVSLKVKQVNVTSVSAE